MSLRWSEEDDGSCNFSVTVEAVQLQLSLATRQLEQFATPVTFVNPAE